MSFEQRLEELKNLKNSNKGVNHLEFIKPIPCNGLNHAYSFLNEVVAKQHAGVLFSDPKAAYQPGWSTHRYKMEHYFMTDVTVISTHSHGLVCKQYVAMNATTYNAGPTEWNVQCGVQHL